MDKKLSYIAAGYLMTGLLFALVFAWYYRWPVFGYFSPGFYAVIITWPYQAVGFTSDVLYYGWGGKPTGI